MQLYKRDSGNWYFKFTDKRGCRKQKCTGTSDKKKAEVFAKAWISENSAPPSCQLREVLAFYLDPATNPKYRECQLDGRAYSIGYAQQVARKTRQLIRLLKDREPHLLTKRMDRFDRADIKTIKLAILEDRGRTRTAEQLLQLLKVVFSQAADDGIIIASPAYKVSEIQHKQEQRISLDPELISWLIDQKDLFPDNQSWAYFTLIATTGMRKGEALAFDRQRLLDGIYTLDRKVNVSGDPDDLGAPKMGHARIIPLPQIALDALDTLPGTGRLFYQKSYWNQKVFEFLRAGAIARDPDHAECWIHLTAHALRHSANTNLLVAGVSKLLIATYLAWEKQDLNETQIRYTHLIGKSLQPVADALDKIYGQKRLLSFAKKA